MPVERCGALAGDPWLDIRQGAIREGAEVLESAVLLMVGGLKEMGTRSRGVKRLGTSRAWNEERDEGENRAEILNVIPEDRGGLRVLRYPAVPVFPSGESL